MRPVCLQLKNSVQTPFARGQLKNATETAGLSAVLEHGIAAQQALFVAVVEPDSAITGAGLVALQAINGYAHQPELYANQDVPATQTTLISAVLIAGAAAPAASALNVFRDKGHASVKAAPTQITHTTAATTAGAVAAQTTTLCAITEMANAPQNA